MGLGYARLPCDIVYSMFAETSNSVEKGQTVTVSLLAFPDRTYEFSVLVKNTGQAVRSE